MLLAADCLFVLQFRDLASQLCAPFQSGGKLRLQFGAFRGEAGNLSAQLLNLQLAGIEPRLV